MGWRIIHGRRIRVEKEPDITVPVLDTTPPEPVVCKQFGCGKHLTGPEQLAGDHCTKHMNTEPININLLIKTK